MRTPLVLLHPFPLDASFWEPLLPALAASRGVHAPEFPGFGRASAEREPSIAGVAEAVAERIAEQCPGGRAVVCGVSMGGYVALALAAQAPERVAGLILAGTRADCDDDQTRSARIQHARELEAGGVESFLEWMLTRLTPEGHAHVDPGVEVIARRQSGAAMAAATRAIGQRPDRTGELAAMDVPALVVWGDRDAAVPAGAARDLAGGLPRGRLEVIGGGGHLAVREKPERFLGLADGLLARVDAGG
jgi:3-oxoadipate enol-lactonase